MNTGQVMTKEVISVERDMPILEVAALLVENRIHGVPVIDENRKIVGIITETDFFSKDSSFIHLSSFIEMIRSEDAEGAIESNKDIEYVLNAKASDIMSVDCFYVNPYIKIEDLIKILRETSYKTIPVADESGSLIGIVTLADIIKLV